MRLGIDLGTTRVVVARADRGNYPVVTFEDEQGEGFEWYPSLLAARGDTLVAGHQARAVAAQPDWALCRSIKRCLTTAGPRDELLGRPVPELATRFLSELRHALLHRSNLHLPKRERLEVAIAVPANANANQRMLTADAFRRAGFEVVRILDEPSVAGLEYAWRRPADAKVKRRHVAVYDLGGGTFDGSIIEMSEDVHEVLTTEGIARLGGDDFDDALLRLCFAELGETPPAPGPECDRLLEICRAEKERINPSTRRLLVELPDGREVRVPIADLEAAFAPLIYRTVSALDLALERITERTGEDIEKHTVVYQVGGASQLPAVGRVLRRRYGRRVKRSPYPHASVAIGLAIAAEGEAQPRILGRFTRYFGVWRERDEGRGAVFDPIFPKDTPLPEGPEAPAVEVSRRYRAAHDIGHFRYVECSRMAGEGAPGGDVTPWREVRFPLVSELAGDALDPLDVHRLSRPGDEVRERYRCDADGVVRVEIANLTAGYARTYALHGRSD